MSQQRTTCLIAAEARCGGLVLGTALGSGGARAFPEPDTEPVFAPDRGFELGRIDLKLRISPSAGTLQGEALLQILPLPSGLGEVVLDLDDVELDAVLDPEGAPLAHRYGGGRLRILGLPSQGGAVTVRYHSRPVRGMYFTGPTPACPDRQAMAWTQCQDEDGHYVFPCLDQPGIKHPWGVEVEVEDPDAAAFTVVGNGRLVRQEGAVWTWEQAEPIPAYLVTVVVGRMLVVEAPGARVPVRYLVPAVDTDGRPADLAQVQRVFGRTPAMVAFLAERLGHPYPWPRYDQVVVHDFIFGGMENVAATTLTDLMLTDERAALDNDHDDLIVHELMHQWFGDLVTCQDWSQGWLNEGWATLSEYLWKVEAESVDEADWHQWAALLAYLDEDGGRYRRAIVSYRFRQPIDVFDRHLYQKASLVLHTLRGELGEAAFWQGVRDYLGACAYQPVHTLDFQRAMEKASGRNLDRFFRQWILGAGHPILTVNLSHSDGLLQVEVEQGQPGGPVAQDPEHLVAAAFHFVLPLAVVHGDRVQEHRLPVRSRSARFTLPCAEAPDRVEVDAHLAVLSALTLKAPRAWLVASLQQDRGIIGRIRAARALAQDGSPQAIRALVTALGAEPFWGVRAEIAGLLGKHGDPTCRDALLAALADPEAKARRAVVEALAGLRDPEVGQAIARLAREGDPSVQVEGAALLALGSLVARGDLAELTAAEARALLQEAAHRPSWADLLTQRALAALGRTRSAEVLDVLLAHTGPRSPDRVRGIAAQALGQLAEEVPLVRRAAVDALIELARASTWRVRYMAIQALGRARDPRALGVLQQVHATALEGRLRRTAWEASQALGAAVEDPAGELRRQLEELQEESRKLRGRVEGLEAGAAAKIG